MATLQIKHLPDDLHAALKRRAAEESTTLSELVTRMIRRELALPSMADWVGTVRGHRAVRRTAVDTQAALDGARDEFDPR